MSLADQASLLLIPTGYKSQKVYSIFPTNGDGDFDFSRPSSATRIAKNGLITTVAANVPRLEYPLIDGVVNGCPSLLLEPQRTNLIEYSIPTNSAPYNYANGGVGLAPIHTANQGISPDGSLNACKIDFNLNGGTSSSDLSQMAYVGSSLTGDYTSSFYLKSFDSNSYTVTLLDPNGVTNKTVITPEWQRFTFYNGGGTTSTNLIRIRLRGNENTSDTASLLAWGFQIEQGSYATSYIPTNGTTVTRLAETANGAGNADTFNDSEGVLMAEISALTSSNGSRDIEISDGNTNRIIIQYNPSGVLQVFVLVNGVTTYTFAYTTLITQFKKIALKYKENDFALWVDGFEADSSNSGSVFSENTLTQLDLLKGVDSSLNFYGKTKQIQYYNSALTDSELEKLTSWTSFSDMATSQLYSIK